MIVANRRLFTISTMMITSFTFRQSFSSGSFESFEETYEGLISKDPENKKLILDQVNITHIMPVHNLFHPNLCRYSANFS